MSGEERADPTGGEPGLSPATGPVRRAPGRRATGRRRPCWRERASRLLGLRRLWSLDEGAAFAGNVPYCGFQLLEENDQLIRCIVEYQNKGRAAECVQ